MAEPRPRFPEIVEGEFVDPYLLHAAVDRAVDAPGSAVELTPPQILGRLRRPDPPGWIRALPLAARLRVDGALRRAGFDLRTRLDDRTLVAAHPDGGERPLLALEVGRAGVDLTRIDLLRFELEAAELVVLEPGSVQAVDGESLLRAVAVGVEDLPPGVTRHRPGLVLRERLRLALVFADLQLGAPISMITLLPGERRTLRTVRSSRARIEETAELGTERRESRELTRSLQREFRRSWEGRRQERALQGVVWSRREPSDGPAGDASSSREGSAEGERAWSLESAAVREALERAAVTAGRETEEVRIEEGIRELVDERERTETAELENRRDDRAVTFVAHGVLAVYRAHLDLVDAELLWRPADPAAGARRVDLRGDWPAALESLPESPGPDVSGRVGALVRARYGKLGALDDGAEPRLLPTPPDAVNLDLASRERMLAADRRDRSGPLPVCLLSRRLAVRAGGTFVRTYVNGPGLGAPAPAPADPDRAAAPDRRTDGEPR